VSPVLLLADDSLTIRRVIELTFADEDVRVIAVADGREAIARITAEPPDIVLADIGMPEHDGYEVAAFVKTSPHLAHIPVLLLTGAFEPVDQARARSVGCDGVLVKPFEPQLVIARVRELLAARGKAAPLPAAGDAGDKPAHPVNPGAPSGTGGDYLDRLDAAFAAMSTAPRPIGVPAPGPSSDADASADAAWSPQIVSNSGEPVHPNSPAPRTSPWRASPPTPGRADAAGPPAAPSLSEAFAALLAAEQGKPLASGPALPALALPEATIDEIARRVITRLGDEPMRQAVLDAAERLVREEIDRIKRAAPRTQ
jgi:CheY-like chemotaxis protein